MSFLILFLTFSFAFAQNPLELTEKDLNPATEDVLIKRRDQHLRHESMIYDLNSDLGIKDQRKFTGTDRNRISMAGHVSGDYEHFTELLGVEFNYMRRSTSYSQFWWGGQFYRHQSRFDAVTQNPSKGSHPYSEYKNSRPNDAKNTIMGAGLGIGHRFKLLLDFFETEDVFESIDVFANSIEFDESHIGAKYHGFGLTTNYGLHKRSNTSYFYGGKFSYNVASVTRTTITDTPSKQRSLSLGWASFAFELGFFF